MDLLGIAAQGLHQADGQFDQAAQRVTQATLDTQPGPDSVSLSDAAVGLLTAKNQFETQVAVAHTADDMQKATLSLLA